MADRSAWRAPEGPESKFRPPNPHYPLGRQRTEKDKGKAPLKKRVASASPLRTVDTNTTSPVRHRQVLSATASIASRTSSLPVTPLDEIPKKLWPRVLRTATPETSNPELSIDEITSTRLSLDDQAILTDLPKSSDRKEAQSRRLLMRTAFGSMWGENNDRLKKMTQKMKKIPNGLFNRKDRHDPDPSTPAASSAAPKSAPGPVLPQPEFTTELCVPASNTSATSGDLANIKLGQSNIDYDCRPKQSGSHEDEMAKISASIRKDLHEVRKSDRILLPPRSGIVDPVPRHFFRAPTYNFSGSIPAVNSVGVENRLSYHQHSLRVYPRSCVGRAPSIGSVDEVRALAFGGRRARRPSISGASFHHSSAPSVTRTSYSTSRPATHSGSSSSVSATFGPKKPLLFMDASNSSSESLWHCPDLQKRASVSSSLALSYAANTTNPNDHISLSASSVPVAKIAAGFGDLHDYEKVPLCVPRRIQDTEKFRDSNLESLRLPNRTETAEHVQDLDITSALVPKEIEVSGNHPTPGLKSVRVPGLIEKIENTEPAADRTNFVLHPENAGSTPTFSDFSLTSLSLCGHTSIQSNLDREAMIKESKQEKKQQSTSGNRQKRSRAFCASLFSGGRQ